MASEKWTWEATQIEVVRRGWELPPAEPRRTNWSGGRRSRDLFGLIDCVALRRPRRGGRGKRARAPTIAIQFTDASNLAKHRTKMLEHPNLPFVLDLGWTVLLWGWRTKGENLLLTEEQILLSGAWPVPADARDDLF